MFGSNSLEDFEGGVVVELCLPHCVEVGVAEWV